MNATELVAELHKRGVVLEADGDSLRYRAPKGALTQDLLDTLRQHKGDILAHLRRPGPTSPPDYAATACVCPVPIGGTGSARCAVCDLPLLCPGCGRCRGCKLRLRFPPGRGPYG